MTMCIACRTLAWNLAWRALSHRLKRHSKLVGAVWSFWMEHSLPPADRPDHVRKRPQWAYCMRQLYSGKGALAATVTNLPLVASRCAVFGPIAGGLTTAAMQIHEQFENCRCKLTGYGTRFLNFGIHVPVQFSSHFCMFMPPKPML